MTLPTLTMHADPHRHERCGRCGRVPGPGQLDYCAHCSRNLCDPCMKLGCCGFVPAASGDGIDEEAEKESLR